MSKEKSKNILNIFMKTPRLGKVKTRLAKDIGNEKALHLYKQFIKTIINNTNSNHYKRNIFLGDSSGKEEVRTYLGASIPILAQSKGDIGDRMFHSFQKVFQDGYHKCIVIGTDTPSINESIIIKAFSLLDEYDAVVGPSNDGGYYLLALKELEKEIFSGIKWSTNSVYRETVKRLHRLKKSTVTLDTLIDIDTVEDLKLANFGNYSSL